MVYLGLCAIASRSDGVNFAVVLMPRGEQLCVRRATQEILRSDAASGCTVLSTAVHCMLHSNDAAAPCLVSHGYKLQRRLRDYLAACKTLASIALGIPLEASASKPD